MTTLRKQVQGFLKPPFSHWRKHRPLLPGSGGGSGYKENRKGFFYLDCKEGPSACLNLCSFEGKILESECFSALGDYLKLQCQMLACICFLGNCLYETLCSWRIV